MGRIKFDDHKPLIKNKLFYVALAVCLAALGISSYGAMSRIRQYEQTPDTSSPESVVSLAEVDKPVSDAPYPEEEAVETKTDVLVEDDTVLTETPPFFTLPAGGEILKNYSEDTLQYSETYKDWRLHLGVDIAVEKGQPVYSCAQGVVDDIYDDPSYGTVVAVDHGGGLMAFYCGLNGTPTVKIDDQVESGSQLGVIDTIPCESVEQAHLHLMMEKDGRAVSPLHAMGMMQ